MEPSYHEMMKTKNLLPFRMGYLTEDLVARAEKELGETEKSKAEAIPALRNLILEDDKLVCPTDDAHLLKYLRARKFNVEKALDLMRNFYQVIKAYPELVDKMDIKDLEKGSRSGVIGCLPYRDENGCVVVHTQKAKWKVDEMSLPTVLRTYLSVLLRCADDPATQVTGVRILGDYRGNSFQQYRQLTPKYVYMVIRCLRNCLPLRFKGFHVYSESFYLKHLWSIFSVFLSDKLKKRVEFIGNNKERLREVIPKAILPSQYGGDNYLSSTSDWFSKEMEPFYSKFMDEVRYGYKD